MQVFVLDDDGVTVFIYNDDNENDSRLPSAKMAVEILAVRYALRGALDFLDDNSGRGGRTEVNE